MKCYDETDYAVAELLRERERPNVAYMVTPDKERRYAGGAIVTQIRRCVSAYGHVSMSRRSS